jgi:hypothetical protein
MNQISRIFEPGPPTHSDSAQMDSRALKFEHRTNRTRQDSEALWHTLMQKIITAVIGLCLWRLLSTPPFLVQMRAAPYDAIPLSLIPSWPLELPGNESVRNGRFSMPDPGPGKVWRAQ